MQFRQIGQHSSHPVAFGTMAFGGMYAPAEDSESLTCLNAAFDAGITHFDTANIYGAGRCESVLGRWIASRKPQGITVATKASIDDSTGPERRANNSRAYLRAELEGSLKRLGLERVDLFYIHRRDPSVPLEALSETLAELIAEGKIGGYGLSEVSPATIRKAHRLLPMLAVQNEYSLWSRQPELGVIQACEELDIALLAFSPLARGMLGNQPLPHPTDGFRVRNPRFATGNFEENTARIDGLRAFCAERGWETPATALAWTLAQSPKIIALPGTRLASHLREWMALPQLSADDLAQIERLLPKGFAAGDRYSPKQYNFVETYC